MFPSIQIEKYTYNGTDNNASLKHNNDMMYTQDTYWLHTEEKVK